MPEVTKQIEQKKHKPIKLIHLFKMLNNSQVKELSDEIIKQKENLDLQNQSRLKQKKENLNTSNKDRDNQSLTKNIKNLTTQKRQSSEKKQIDCSQIVSQQNNPSVLSQDSLELDNVTLRSIQILNDITLLGQIIVFAKLKKLNVAKGLTESKHNVLKILSNISESRLREINLKLPIFSSIITSMTPVSFPILTALNLNFCKIVSIQNLIWMELPSLKTLNLQWNNISNVDSLSRVNFGKTQFLSLFVNNNMVKKFDKFSRIGTKNITALRIDSVLIPYEENLLEDGERKLYDPQSEDLSFLLKTSFSTQFLRILHKNRIKQNFVENCIYRMDRLMYVCG